MTMKEEEGVVAIATEFTGAGEDGQARGHASTAATTNAFSADGSSAAAISNAVWASIESGGIINCKNLTTINKFPPQYLCPFLLGEPLVDVLRYLI